MKNKILVVDDDRELQLYLHEVLFRERYVVETVSNGADALKLVKSFAPNVVLLDLGLPDIKGEILYKEIKRENPETVVIILTARDTPLDIVKGLNLGADDYMSKPFLIEELLARIKARLVKV